LTDPDGLAPSADEGRGLHRSHSSFEQHVERRRADEDRVCLDVLDDDARSALERRPTGSLTLLDRVPELQPPVRESNLSRDLQMTRLTIQQPHVAEVGTRDADRRFDDLAEKGLDISPLEQRRAGFHQAVRGLQIGAQLFLALAQLRNKPFALCLISLALSDLTLRRRNSNGAALVIDELGDRQPSARRAP
jgi:hypothetical protein